MQEDDELADLIGNIHDAALDPGLWTDVVAQIIHFVGAQAGGLVFKDPVSKFACSPYNSGVDPHYVELYEATYAKFDPLATLPQLGRITSIPDLVSYDDYRRGRFTQEWLQPQGWTDAAMVTLEKSGPNRATVLVLMPGKASGMVDDELRRRLALIAPHARRALLIGKASQLKQSEATTFAEALNFLSAGIFLVDAGGSIVHTNAAGHDMLYAYDFLRSADGRLVARDAQINQILRELYAACANGDAGIGARGISLPLIAHDRERYIAHVLPVNSGLRRIIGLAHQAVAAVFVRKAEAFPPRVHRTRLH